MILIFPASLKKCYLRRNHDGEQPTCGGGEKWNRLQLIDILIQIKMWLEVEVIVIGMGLGGGIIELLFLRSPVTI